MPVTIQPNEAVALAVVTVGAWTSWKTLKIPNLLTFPAAIVGLLLAAISSGFRGVMNCVLTYLSILILGRLVMRLSFGAVKLLAAIGALLGFAQTVVLICFFMVLYALVGITELHAGKSEEQLKERRRELVPLGPMIALATVFCLLFSRAKW